MLASGPLSVRRCGSRRLNLISYRAPYFLLVSGSRPELLHDVGAGPAAAPRATERSPPREDALRKGARGCSDTGTVETRVERSATCIWYVITSKRCSAPSLKLSCGSTDASLESQALHRSRENQACLFLLEGARRRRRTSDLYFLFSAAGQHRHLLQQVAGSKRKREAEANRGSIKKVISNRCDSAAPNGASPTSFTPVQPSHCEVLRRGRDVEDDDYFATLRAERVQLTHRCDFFCCTA